VPVSGAVCGDPAALSEIVTEAVLVPTMLGVNVTLIVQVLDGATLEQLLLWKKSPGLVPVSETDVIVSVAVPVLVTVIDCAPLVVLIF
jgi:hypothetical protein